MKIVQVIVCLIILTLHLPTLFLAMALVTPLRFGAGVGFILGSLTTSAAVLFTLIAAVASRGVRRNPFVWIINGVGIATAVWVQMKINEGF